MALRRVQLLAGLAAALTGILIYTYLASLQGQQVTVVLAARDLPAGHRVAAADLRLAEMPVNAIHPLARTDPAAVIGRFLLVPVVAGQVLLEAHLAPPAAPGPVAARLEPGHVAFFVPLPVGRSLGGAVEAGDRIDLVFVRKGDFAAAGAAYTLVHGARVLERRAEDGSRYDETSAGSQLPLGLLVQVRPDEAARLAFAMEHGTLYTVLPSSGAQVPPPMQWEGVQDAGSAEVETMPGGTGGEANGP